MVHVIIMASAQERRSFVIQSGKTVMSVQPVFYRCYRNNSI